MMHKETKKYKKNNNKKLSVRNTNYLENYFSNYLKLRYQSTLHQAILGVIVPHPRGAQLNVLFIEFIFGFDNIGIFVLLLKL